MSSEVEEFGREVSCSLSKMLSSIRLMSVGLLVAVCLLGSSLVDSNPIDKDLRAETRRLLNEKLENVNMNDEEAVYELFEEWASEHDITFTDDSQRMDALLTWKKNALKIKTHRKEHKEGKHTYQLGLNMFAHKTSEELSKTKLGYKNTKPRVTSDEKKSMKVKRSVLPTNVDWVAAGIVTSVKDQGNCGCCWSFSATAVLESAYAKAKGILQDFSEEEFVDCIQDCIGCDGGVPAEAVDLVNTNKGIATLVSYPYIAQNLQYNPTCNVANSGIVNVSMTPSYTWLNDDASILAAVAIQPVSACISVGGDNFYYYESGILDPATACDGANINHAIVVVGYGVDPTTNIAYWKLKNSWAADWGELGYVRINRNVTSSCGLDVEALKVDMTFP